MLKEEQGPAEGPEAPQRRVAKKEKEMIKKNSYKGDEYIVLNTAKTMNDGEYYVCVKMGEWAGLCLIPTDSELVTEG